MKVVAFLQNQWFRDPERVRDILANPRYGKTAAEWREFHIAAFLFMGCLTGKRLRSALGEDWIYEIVWEEVSREYGGHASSVFPPDWKHIRDVIKRHRPGIVLSFGKIATDSLRLVQRDDDMQFKLIVGPHPAARHTTVMDELRLVRKQLDGLKAKRKLDD